MAAGPGAFIFLFSNLCFIYKMSHKCAGAITIYVDDSGNDLWTSECKQHT
eukprot:SAG31_NODE_23886_length_493_cov_1.063452_1_plen_49_part_01